MRIFHLPVYMCVMLQKVMPIIYFIQATIDIGSTITWLGKASILLLNTIFPHHLGYAFSPARNKSMHIALRIQLATVEMISKCQGMPLGGFFLQLYTYASYTLTCQMPSYTAIFNKAN